MSRKALMTWRQVAVLCAVLVLLAAILALWHRFGPRAVSVTAGSGPEELGYVRSSDDMINGGAIFIPTRDSPKPVAILWVHGWGVNFYYPTYVQIGRAVAALGYPFISVNTRKSWGQVWKPNFSPLDRVTGKEFWTV